MRDPHDSFWTYEAPKPQPDAPAPYVAAGWTREQWESLSPGMRREIERDSARRATKGA